MLDKLKALYAVFQQGKAVANPDALRNHQVSANMIAGFLFAIVTLLKCFGYDFGIDMQTCADISVGLLAAINLGITVASSTKHGLPSGAVREAEQTLPSTEQPAAEAPTNVQADVTSDAGRGDATPTIDEDVRARATEWARQHSATNNLSNNA